MSDDVTKTLEDEDNRDSLTHINMAE